nr:hypothetical protein JVH1_2459 [Rhodococcus sp. JVH1]
MAGGGPASRAFEQALHVRRRLVRLLDRDVPASPQPPVPQRRCQPVVQRGLGFELQHDHADIGGAALLQPSSAEESGKQPGEPESGLDPVGELLVAAGKDPADDGRRDGRIHRPGCSGALGRVLHRFLPRFRSPP